MKKFGFLYGFIAAFLVINTGYTACNTPVTLSFSGNQDPDDNEFLYETKAQFDLTESGYKNSGNKNSGDGHGYECDHFNSGGCSEGEIITMQPNHVFKGKVINRKVKYQCNVDSGDSWEVVNDGICHTKGFGDISVGECVGNGNGECRILTDVDCSGYTKTDNSAIRFKGICRDGPTFICKATKCKNGMRVDNDGKCIEDSRQQPTPDPVQPAPQPRKTCREQRTTLNGKACCDTLSLGVYKKATDTCECKNGMTFVIENGTGYCRPSNVTPGTKYDCDATFLAQIAGWKVACAKNSDIVELINQIEEFCKGDNKTEAVFMAFYNTLLGYNPQQCDKTSENMTAQINDVNNAYSQLTAIHNKFRDNVSVWKDAEGNFNTARLASDTVAGVVLGTTGALVTSHVVKKNQVENGFEDIKCTIGGQNVAGWGDQFRVGIQ